MNHKYISHIENLAYGGLDRTVTPDDVAEHLIKQGLAKHVVGGLIATPAAQQMLLSHGRRPPIWK